MAALERSALRAAAMLRPPPAPSTSAWWAALGRIALESSASPTRTVSAGGPIYIGQTYGVGLISITNGGSITASGPLYVAQTNGHRDVSITGGRHRYGRRAITVGPTNATGAINISNGGSVTTSTVLYKSAAAALERSTSPTAATSRQTTTAAVPGKPAAGTNGQHHQWRLRLGKDRPSPLGASAPRRQASRRPGTVTGTWQSPTSAVPVRTLSGSVAHGTLTIGSAGQRLRSAPQTYVGGHLTSGSGPAPG